MRTKYRIYSDSPETAFGIGRDRAHGYTTVTQLARNAEDCADAGLALRDALVGLRSFGQRVGFNYRFDSSLGYVIEGFVICRHS